MPTLLLREHVDLLTPYVTAVVNSSLSQGRLTDSQKHAIVLPLIKKPGLDSSRHGEFLSSIEPVLSIRSDRESSESATECLYASVVQKSLYCESHGSHGNPMGMGISKLISWEWGWEWLHGNGRE